MQLPEREMLLSPFLLSQGLCLLYAKRGVGKTHIALGIAYAVATGGKFLKWTAPHPKKVLYIDGEMSASAMQERLRRISVSVLFIHHAGKGGQQRGTSKKEDILDAVLLLKHPSGYTPDQGLVFEVLFEKNLHFTGTDAETFRVSVREQDDGLWKWVTEEPTVDLDMQKVVAAKKESLSIRAIAEKTGLSKSQVETKLKAAKDQNLYNLSE